MYGGNEGCDGRSHSYAGTRNTMPAASNAGEAGSLGSVGWTEREKRHPIGSLPLWAGSAGDGPAKRRRRAWSAAGKAQSGVGS